MQASMKDVAFWSSTPQQGKTTAARYLQHFGYAKFAFADPLYAMLRSMLLTAGYERSEIDFYLSEGKEEVISEIGASCRHLTRTLGTEWGRHIIDQNLWVKVARKRILKEQEDIYRRPICFDDLRFPNELELLKRHGFTLIRVVRETGRSDSHVSDLALRDYDGWDHVVENNGTPEEFNFKIQKLLEWN